MFLSPTPTPTPSPTPTLIYNVHLTNGDSGWTIAAALGTIAAAVIALGIALWSEWRRRKDRDSDQVREARNIIVVAWPDAMIYNFSSTVIRNVACLGGAVDLPDNVTLRLVQPHKPREVRPKEAFIRPGDMVDISQKHNAPWDRRRTDNPDEKVTDPNWDGPPATLTVTFEWTDSHGIHWRRHGTDEPQIIKSRDTHYPD